MRLEEIIYYKYNNINMYKFMVEHIAITLSFKEFKIIYPYWINYRFKELEKLYNFYKYKKCLEDIYIRNRKNQKEV